MIKQVHQFQDLFQKLNFKVTVPEFTQIMSEEELIELVPQFDGWIIGDDPATRKVFEAGQSGKLKAAVKWGVGVDNVDFKACADLKIPITNTPGMFGEDVSDVAIGMLLNLTRELNLVNDETKKGGWYKPCGVGLVNKKVCLIGFGDIGKTTARKLKAFQTDIWVSDPGFKEIEEPYHLASFEECMKDAQVVVITCSLNQHTKYLINETSLRQCQKGVIVINVARGPIIKEDDLIKLMGEGHVGKVGLDVFEVEPLPQESKLRGFKNTFFGSHNGSNSIDSVVKTSYRASYLLEGYLR